MKPTVLFEGGGFTVTTSTLKSPRRTYELRNIELVSIKRPLFQLCGSISIGLLAFTAAFVRYLYPLEILALLAFAAIAIVGSSMVGTLKIHSLAMRGDEGVLYGRIDTLRAVKEAVSRALDARQAT